MPKLIRGGTDQAANRGTQGAYGHQAQQQMVTLEGTFLIMHCLTKFPRTNIALVPCPRTSHLELLAQRLEGGLDRLETFGHKLESGVLRALCSISLSVPHVHDVDSQHQLSLEQELEGHDHIIRVLSKVKMLEDESDDEAEEAFSD